MFLKSKTKKPPLYIATLINTDYIAVQVCNSNKKATIVVLLLGLVLKAINVTIHITVNLFTSSSRKFIL